MAFPKTGKMLFSVYLHAGDKTFRVGMITATHQTENLDFVVPGKFDRISIKDNKGLLADVKQ